jgi:hypothetical protein
MLGRLRMSVYEAIDAYARLAGRIFSKKKWWWKEGRFSARSLERAINIIVGERVGQASRPAGYQTRTSKLSCQEEDRIVELGKSVMMLNEHWDSERCRV